jgi:hypothetical protein
MTDSAQHPSPRFRLSGRRRDDWPTDEKQGDAPVPLLSALMRR